MTDPVAAAKETKDWAPVAEQGCDECGCLPVPGPQIGDRLRQTTGSWGQVLHSAQAARRPEPQVWSPVEYAAHVRDMCRLAVERVQLMLQEDTPTFSNWDQDERAVTHDYFHASPTEISSDLEHHLRLAAHTFDAVAAGDWTRPGLRGDGRAFTVSTFASFVLHEVEHHLQDARRGVGHSI